MAEVEPGHVRDTVPAPLSAGQLPQQTSTWPSSAAAPPACTRRSGRQRAGARTALVSRKPLRESSSYWAQGGLAAALSPDDSIARHAEDTFGGRPRPLPRGCRLRPGRGGARRRAVADRSRRRVRPRALRRARARASRAGTRRGGSSMPAAARPAARSPGAWPRSSPRPTDLTVLAETSAQGLWSDGSRCHGVVTDRGPPARDRDDPRHRRSRGAVEAHDEPLGSDRRRLRASPTPRAPSSATSSSASSTRPRSACPAASTTAS